MINWNKICRPTKDEGGVGFRQAKELNLAFTMKLAWSLVSKPNSLWVQVLKNKYRLGEGSIPNVRLRQSVQVLGNWDMVKIWQDHWLPGVHSFANQKINEYVTERGDWN